MGARVFIGSSRESMDAMDELATWIEDAGHHAKPWTDPDVLPLASTTFDSLHRTAERVDAAIFVFGEDDATWYHGDKTHSPRDNVILEYGVFSGVLGERSVAIALIGNPRLATDLAGITYLPLDQKARAKLKLKTWLADLQCGAPRVAHARAHAPFFTTADPEDREFDFTRRLAGAKSLDLLGYSMAHMFASSKTQLADALAGGLRVRVMILDPHSTAGTLMAEKVGDFQRVQEPHERSVRYLREIIEIAASNGPIKGSLQVKYVPWIPSCYLNIVNAHDRSGEALVGVNALNLGGRLPRRIHFILQHSKDEASFRFFVAQFDALWSSVPNESLLYGNPERA